MTYDHSHSCIAFPDPLGYCARIYPAFMGAVPWLNRVGNIPSYHPCLRWLALLGYCYRLSFCDLT